MTFLSEPGNLNEMTVVDISGLTATGSTVQIRTLRDGNSNVWYNYKYGLSSIRGRLYPAWLMVLPEDPSGNHWSNISCVEIDPGEFFLKTSRKKKKKKKKRRTLLLYIYRTVGLSTLTFHYLHLMFSFFFFLFSFFFFLVSLFYLNATLFGR